MAKQGRKSGRSSGTSPVIFGSVIAPYYRCTNMNRWKEGGDSARFSGWLFSFRLRTRFRTSVSS